MATRTDYSLRFRSGVQAATQTATQTTTLSTTRVRMSSDSAAMNYIQDLLQWVEENQRAIDVAEWGEDLPTVQSQLGSHRGLHQAIEDFRPKIERARADEVRHTRARTYTGSHVHTGTHTRAHTHLRTRAYANTWARTLTRGHMHAHALRGAHTSLNAHTCTLLIHTYIWTREQLHSAHTHGILMHTYT